MANKHHRQEPLVYLRFETDLKFNPSSCNKGIFAAMGNLKKQDSMRLDEHISFIHIANWFNRQLANPICFEGGRFSGMQFKAQCWFKLNSKNDEYLQKSAMVAKLLQKYHISVKVILHSDPGEIVYEDARQIVVINVA